MSRRGRHAGATAGDASRRHGCSGSSQQQRRLRSSCCTASNEPSLACWRSDSSSMLSLRLPATLLVNTACRLSCSADVSSASCSRHSSCSSALACGEEAGAPAGLGRWQLAITQQHGITQQAEPRRSTQALPARACRSSRRAGSERPPPAAASAEANHSPARSAADSVRRCGSSVSGCNDPARKGAALVPRLTCHRRSTGCPQHSAVRKAEACRLSGAWGAALGPASPTRAGQRAAGCCEHGSAC